MCLDVLCVRVLELMMHGLRGLSASPKNFSTPLQDWFISASAESEFAVIDSLLTQAPNVVHVGFRFM